MNDAKNVSLATFRRMPVYLRCLKNVKAEGGERISSVALAKAVSQNAAVVKKDLSYVKSGEGKPGVGYQVSELIKNIEALLGYNNTKDAIMIGVGKLGQALLGYRGFDEAGLNIVAGFDVDDRVIGKEIHGKPIMPIGKMVGAVERLNVKTAILTIPPEHAQETTDLLIKAGIRAIWNFTTAHIRVPDNIALKNENLAASLAELSAQLKEKLRKEA